MHTLMPCSGARDRLSDGSEGRDRQIHEMILLNEHGKLPPQQAGRADAALAEMSVQLHLAHYRKGTPEVPARPEQGCPSAERSANQSGGALISLQTFKEFMTHVPIRKAVDALIRTSLSRSTQASPSPRPICIRSPGGVSGLFVSVRLLCRSSRRKGEQNFCSVRRPGGSTPAAVSTNGTWPDSGPAVIKQFF